MEEEQQRWGGGGGGRQVEGGKVFGRDTHIMPA